MICGSSGGVATRPHGAISTGGVRGAENLSRDFSSPRKDSHAARVADLAPRSGEACPVSRTRRSCVVSPDLEADGLAELALGGAAALGFAAASRAVFILGIRSTYNSQIQERISTLG